MVQVIGCDREVLATARLVGRESLPTARPDMAASIPALHWEDCPPSPSSPPEGAAPAAARFGRLELAAILSQDCPSAAGMLRSLTFRACTWMAGTEIRRVFTGILHAVQMLATGSRQASRRA